MPTAKMFLMIGYVVLLKSLVAAGIFFTLSRKLNFSNYSSIVGGIIYGLNGYLILWGQHYIFGLAVIYFPLLLLGLEIWLRDKKASFFLITLFFVAIWSYYFLYMMSIFLCFYFLFRVYTLDEMRKRVISHIIEFAMLYLLGVGLAAFILVPTIFVVLESPRIGAGVIDIPLFMNQEYYFSLISRFFANQLNVGTHHFYDWWNMYELPNIYCSTLALLLFPFAYLSLPKGKKRFFAKWAILFLIFTLTIPIFALFMNAFSYIAYRWTFVVIPLIILFSLNGLEYFERAEKPPIFYLLLSYSGVALLLLLTIFTSSWVFGWNDISISDKIFSAIPTLLTLSIYTILLILISYDKWKKIGKLLLLLVLAIELGKHASIDIHDRVLLNADFPTSKLGIFDDSKKIINDLKEQQKDFFRVIKTTSNMSFNDPIAQGFFGISSYAPLNSRGNLDFLKTMNVYSPNHNYTNISPDRILLNSFLAVRYQILDNPNDTINGYKFIKKNGRLSIFENTNFLPLGLIFDQYTELNSFCKLSSIERDRTILKAVVLSDYSSLKNGLEKARFNSITQSSATPLKFDTSSSFINMDLIKNDFPLNLEFDTKVNDPYIVIRSLKPFSGQLHVSFTFETDKNVTGQIYWRYGDDAFKIDKAQYFMATQGNKTYTLDLGYIAKADRLRIELSNVPGSFKVSNFHAEVTQIPLMDEYKKDSETLRSKAMVITQWNDSSIEGVVDLTRNGILVMQIPIAAGWEAFVDDLPVKIEEVDGGLIGIPIQQGKHKVVIAYKPPFEFIGIVISIGSLIIILLWFFRKKVFLN